MDRRKVCPVLGEDPGNSGRPGQTGSPFCCCLETFSPTHISTPKSQGFWPQRRGRVCTQPECWVHVSMLVFKAMEGPFFGNIAGIAVALKSVNGDTLNLAGFTVQYPM